MGKHKLRTEYVDLHPHHCVACWQCVEACPRQVIGGVRFLWHRHAVITDAEACVGCGKCVGACPKGCFTKRV